MKVATVRDLRNRFARIFSWIEEGERVEVSRRGRVIATLVPARRRIGRVEWPDFMTRLRDDWPDGVPGKPLSEIIAEGRGESG
jgi:antitoxin (DNA-binding transcriptional repressor) of toxin-antitoxin stability system